MIEDKGSDEDQIQLGDDEKDLIELGDDKDDEVKPSTSKMKPKIMDPDQGMSDEYKKYLNENNLPLPSQIYKTIKVRDNKLNRRFGVDITPLSR